MKLNGSCHCGAVRFTAEIPEGLASARRCDCSFCAMRGAVAVTAPLDGLKVTQGADKLTLYTFNTGVAQHHFCSVCGIYTHHRRRSNPNEYGVNLACLEGQTPFLPEIDVADGRHHPSDGGADSVAGVLRYTPKVPG
ncbi:GFA family protein [Halovulum sp. GXIMD14794]